MCIVKLPAQGLRSPFEDHAFNLLVFVVFAAAAALGGWGGAAAFQLAQEIRRRAGNGTADFGEFLQERE